MNFEFSALLFVTSLAEDSACSVLKSSLPSPKVTRMVQHEGITDELRFRTTFTAWSLHYFNFFYMLVCSGIEEINGSIKGLPVSFFKKSD